MPGCTAGLLILIRYEMDIIFSRELSYHALISESVE